MDNQIVLVANEKGGVGKTTTSFNLGVMRAICGYRVMLVDVDPQCSLTSWSHMRRDAGFEPIIPCIQLHGKLGLDLIQLKSDYDVIVDAGGRDTVEMRQAIGVADKWVIPVKPGQLDLLSMQKMNDLRNEVAMRVGRVPETSVLLNMCAFNTNEAQEARELLETSPEDEDYDIDIGSIPVLKTQLVDRAAIRRSMRHRCSVVEMPKNEGTRVAIEEFINLYEEVFGEKYEPKI